jgi:hypothetical protein
LQETKFFYHVAGILLDFTSCSDRVQTLAKAYEAITSDAANLAEGLKGSPAAENWPLDSIPSELSPSSAARIKEVTAKLSPMLHLIESRARIAFLQLHNEVVKFIHWRLITGTPLVIHEVDEDERRQLEEQIARLQETEAHIKAVWYRFQA